VLDIATAAQEQSSGVQEVNLAITDMDRVTQQNAALVEESSAASVSLAQEADSLAGLVRQFKVDGESGRAARPARAA